MRNGKYTMKKSTCLKRILAAAIIIIQVISIMSISFAQEDGNFKSKKIHRQLHDLGIFKGIPEYTPPSDSDLSISYNRELGIYSVLRSLGYEEKSIEMSDEETANILSKYTDANKLSSWARKMMAFAIKSKFVLGVSENKLGAKDDLTGNMFCTLALRAMGYKVDKNDHSRSCDLLAEKGGLTIDQAALFKDKKLIKDDYIIMLYGLLKAVRADNKTVIEKLIEDGIVYKDKAKEYGLIE